MPDDEPGEEPRSYDHKDGDEAEKEEHGPALVAYVCWKRMRYSPDICKRVILDDGSGKGGFSYGIRKIEEYDAEGDC